MKKGDDHFFTSETPFIVQTIPGCRISRGLGYGLAEGSSGPLSAEFVAEITRVQRQVHAFNLSMAWNLIEADETAIEDKAFEAWRMALATCLQKLSAEQRKDGGERADQA